MSKKIKDYSNIESEKYNELFEILESIRPKVHRFYNEGFSAPGTDVRLGLKKLQNLAQEMRIEVSAIRKEKTKK